MRLSEMVAYAGTDIAYVPEDCEVTSVELCKKIKGNCALTYLMSEKFLADLSNPAIVAVICQQEMSETIQKAGKKVLISDEPKFCFYSLHNYVANQCKQKAVLQDTVLGMNCNIHPSAIIAQNGVTIGNRVTIEAGVIIHPHCTIGDDAYICSGSVIGARSFNPARYKGRSIMMEDCGSVVIEEHVTVCSNSVIVRGVLPNEETRIGSYSVIDTMVHIAHGVNIGKCSFIVSGSSIGGNAVIGSNCWVGINATVSNRIVVGDGARVSLGSVVTKNVPDNETVTGNFAIEHQKFLINLKNSIV